MLKQTFTPQQETSSFLKYLKKCNVKDDLCFTNDTMIACANFQPVVVRIRIIENEGTELKSSEVSKKENKKW